MSSLEVRDVMTSPVQSVTTNEDLLTVRDRMWELEVRHLPVVDRRGHLVGLVSQRDLLRALGPVASLPSSEAAGHELTQRPVSEVMTKEVETVPPELDARRAAMLIYRAKLGCLPVIDSSRLIGIVTESDFVRLFLEGA